MDSVIRLSGLFADLQGEDAYSERDSYCVLSSAAGNWQHAEDSSLECLEWSRTHLQGHNGNRGLLASQ